MKRTISLLLAICAIIGVFAIPASAASNWSSEMSTEFKPVSAYYAGVYPKYVWAIQRFFFAFSGTQSEMAGSSHDGAWGSKTRAALGKYQRNYMGETPDYIAGSRTWTSIAGTLKSTPGRLEEMDCHRLVLKESGSPVFMATYGSNPTFFYFYGTGTNAQVSERYNFHPFNG